MLRDDVAAFHIGLEVVADHVDRLHLGVTPQDVVLNEEHRIQTRLAVFNNLRLIPMIVSIQLFKPMKERADAEVWNAILKS